MHNCKAQYAVLHNFNDTAGKFPYGGLAISGDTLYGMTNVGGASQNGVIYSIRTDGTGFTVLHVFSGGLDGGLPYGTLVVSGNTLYGMNFNGGGSFAYGVIFSMQTNGSNFNSLYAFNYNQGGLPYGSITISGDTLFGMATYGGANNDGMVFSILTNGTNYTDLFDFNGPQGNAPYYNSLIVAGGTLYGMTPGGGAHNYGLIFSMATDGINFTDLHDFNNTQGAGPNASLILAGNTLYGMTSGGGTHGYGTIFSVQTNGTGFTDIHNFDGLHGSGPLGSLTLFGNMLYGMTNSGGANASGTIFSVAVNGNNFTDMVDFTGARGAWPQSSSFVISGSTLYSTTAGGGTLYNGTVFKLTVPALSAPQLSASTQSVTVYPNPSNGVFNVQLSAVSGQSSVEVYNMLGEKIYSQTFSTQHSAFNLGLQPAGVYLYRVLNENSNLVGSGKLIIQ